MLAGLDTVRVGPVSLAGRHDTLRVMVETTDLPPWCVIEPARVEVFVPLEQAVTRRFPVTVDSPRGSEKFRVSPPRVTAVVTAPRRLATDATTQVRPTWWAPVPHSRFVGRRVVVRNVGDLPGLEVRFEPDSVLLQSPLP